MTIKIFAASIAFASALVGGSVALSSFCSSSCDYTEAAAVEAAAPDWASSPCHKNR